MGNFSWITKNGNPIKIGKPAWMVFKLEHKYTEVIYTVKTDEYEGNGVFNVLEYEEFDTFVEYDYYIILFKMNYRIYNSFSDNTMREYGIDIEFGLKEVGNPTYPQLFDHEPTPQEIDAIDWSYQCESDPNQGN